MNKNARILLTGFMLPIAILVLQNSVIFWNHYFRDFGFPWDFPLNYYAIVAFWTSLASQGVIPSWIPFQSMGLPMDLSLQSGMHYPLLWIFPLLKMEYTLHAAVIFQCLHILLGAVGMYAFLRLTLKSTNLAILGAFIFQFFGGFYSNAEHVDIIRAFSYAPWLLFAFTILGSENKLSWRLALIPPVLLFLFTGGYPGNQISGVIILGLFVFLQLIDLRIHGKNVKKIIRLSLMVLLFSAIGLGLSFYHIGPAVLFKNYLYRSGSFESELRATFWIPQLPGLFLENTNLPGEISMTSAYVTLPTLILLSYIPMAIIKKYWYMVGIALTSFVLAAGRNSFIGYFLWKFISPLKYSRFPSSDYRIFIIIPLIFFAVLSLNAIQEGKLNWKNFLFRTGIVILWFGQTIFTNYKKLSIPLVYQAITILILTILVLISFQLYKKMARNPNILPLLPIFLLVSLDAARVLPLMSQNWQVPSFSAFYEKLDWPLLDDKGALLSKHILTNLPNQRPARIEKESMDYSWEGYITGRFIYNDLVPHLLKAPHLVDDQEIYKRYMLEKWTPVFIDVNPDDLAKVSFEISPGTLGSKLQESPGQDAQSVQQTRYGINEIKYLVSIDRPYLMVENEIYFPGWTARLESDKGISKIQALPVNDLFRGWVLPAGKYTMVADFNFPGSKLFKAISLGALLAWILLLLGWRQINNLTFKVLEPVVRQ